LGKDKKKGRCALTRGTTTTDRRGGRRGYLLFSERNGKRKRSISIGIRDSRPMEKGKGEGDSQSFSISNGEKTGKKAAFQ